MIRGGDLPLKGTHTEKFNFFSLEELRSLIPEDHLLDDNAVRFHTDPFFAECRSFGRLVQKKKDDLLAVRCYGYALLPEEVERRIERQFGISDWNRGAEDEGHPLRAIVKALIWYKTPFGRKKFPAMRRTLEELNKLQILNMDIREENYLGGRLFDFSIAITPPHLALWSGLRSEDQILEDMDDDIECFDSMVEEVEDRAKSKLRIWDDRLRSRT